MLRRALEQILRDRAFRRRLPESVGGETIYVSAAAGLRFVFRPMAQVDPSLFALAAEFVKPGQIVWDIGANIGLFAFSAAHFSGPKGQVFAIEPDSWLVQLLRQSAKQASKPAAPVTIIPAAVGEENALRTFHIASRARSSSHLKGFGSTQAGGIAEQQTVVTLSLDWLATQIPAPDLIKIDIEGAELEALQGATGLLATKRPIIVCEVSADYCEKVTALLHSFDYELFDGEQARSKRAPAALAPWNTVAVPRR